MPAPPARRSEALAPVGVPPLTRPPRPSLAGALGRFSSPPDVVSTRLAERLSERRAARRRLTLVRAGLLVAGTVAACALAWLLLASPVLTLHADEVRVVSSGPSVEPALVAAAVQPWTGTPLTRIDTGDVAAAVRGVEAVRAASVRRAWPHGLIVEVEARVPVVAVPLRGRYALLDVDGIQVGDRVDAAPAGMPVVALPRGDGGEALASVLQVLDALPPDLVAQITDVTAASTDRIGFRLEDGARVEWGSGELSDLKVRVLEVLRGRPAEVYDVSAPTMPVIR